MISSLGGINTNFEAPTLPNNPTTQQVLEFEKQIMLFSTLVSAATTAINTIGNAEKGAAGRMAQGG